MKKIACDRKKKSEWKLFFLFTLSLGHFALALLLPYYVTIYKKSEV